MQASTTGREDMGPPRRTDQRDCVPGAAPGSQGSHRLLSRIQGGDCLAPGQTPWWPIMAAASLGMVGAGWTGRKGQADGSVQDPQARPWNPEGGPLFLGPPLPAAWWATLEADGISSGPGP